MADARPSRFAWAAPALGAALLALGAALKLVSGAGGPLWLDEGWTLGIVDRPSWSAFAEQLRLDVNPPLYFVLIRGWTALAGLSDAALRAPSVLFAAVAPLVVLLGRPPLPRPDRWAAAAAVGLLPVGVYFAQEARAYALLLLLETGAAVALLRLLDRPTTARAAVWCAFTAAACLTHHHAVLVGGLQGLAYLAVHRLRAVRKWPAALCLLPWLAWSVPQAPRVLAFARPEFSWYAPLLPSEIPGVLGLLTGGTWPLWGLLLIAGALGQRLLAARGVAPGEPASRPALALFAAAAAAVAVVLGMGLLRPSFTPRYLVPAAPGLMIGMIAALRWASPRGAPVLQFGLLGVLAVGVSAAALSADVAERRAYSIEQASADLRRAGVRRLAFLWDNPTDGVLAPPERAALADAFFVRAGAPVAVTGLPHAPGDPNARLLAATPPGGGLLWLWDVRVPRTAAIRFPPRLAAEPGLSCRRYAGGALGVVACVRAPARWR